jgi:hypothetical protein
VPCKKGHRATGKSRTNVDVQFRLLFECQENDTGVHLF